MQTMQAARPTLCRIPTWCSMCRVVVLPVALVVLAACGTPGAGSGTQTSLTTDTRSAQFTTDAEKVAFVRRYLTLFSPVEATEFHIVYHDNSGGRVPGPSDWDMRVALLVAPADVPSWIDGLRQIDRASVDLSWGIDLLPNERRWAHTSDPQVYERESGGVIVAVFTPEGLVLKRIWTEQLARLQRVRIDPNAPNAPYVHYRHT